MTDATSLTNHFLIAMPGLQDPNFARTVTYVCEHSEEGAMGIVINRPMEIQLGEVLAQLEIEPEVSNVSNAPVYLGGPVQTDRGFVIHDGNFNFDSTLRVTDQIQVTTSRDVLEAIAKGQGPANRLIALGYAGWGSGQLEQEMIANAWLSGPANGQILFSTPSGQRWQSAAQLLGVDLNLLSGQAGHA
ncbi:MAG: YqgE/AlgH family protein [Lamprobacter sp.]|uniref:YqgE/AlgH family protein n=1 Tax=Lamprobacter sp. TaxID=3100796 RepID=UPI002B263F42|nr:YqgE/AlgH family protein [Lamprobacter sp.]MEA3640504.1 YqgE/AlgH family protein [Lamprobacter sp.]